MLFQSTLPVKGATPQLLPFVLGHVFQSTLPVKGATIAADDNSHDQGRMAAVAGGYAG